MDNEYGRTDFAEYGKQVELIEPWRGYHRGTIIALNGKGQYVIQFSSGATIEVYPDEVEFD